MRVTSLFYAAGFSVPSVTVVVVDIVSAPLVSVEHAKEGNLWKRAARYLGWLKSHREKISVKVRYNLSDSSFNSRKCLDDAVIFQRLERGFT